jgi:hypothetical protein
MEIERNAYEALLNERNELADRVNRLVEYVDIETIHMQDLEHQVAAVRAVLASPAEDLERAIRDALDSPRPLDMRLFTFKKGT